MDITVLKRDGSRQPYNANLINQSLERACETVSDPVGKVMQIASETELTLFDGISTEQLDQALINTAVQNIKDDPEFDTIATRLFLKLIYKKVLGDFVTDQEFAEKHLAGFTTFINKGIDEKVIDPRLGKKNFKLKDLAAAIDTKRDSLLKYIGLTAMTNRYMLKDRSQVLMETPQYFFMRVAMGLALTEKNPTDMAIKFYDKMSRLEYLAAGSTLVNAGTPFPQLSNCFLMEMQDDIGHIGKSVVDVMRLTKGTGGIGLGVTKLRAQGSPINTTNTFSTGPIPFMHTIDSILRAVSRGGKKFGALCFYMENWHLDFPDFLDLKENSGDPYRRTRTANTAVWISDEFMKRVQDDEDWYLFDPQETPDLNELYGAEFSKRYKEYIEMAEAGKMRTFKKIRAKEQFRAILISLQTTSHPWLTWKDTINNRALNNNTGTIHLSNLCTEICLPQDRDNIAVCNLASINLPKHLINGKIDYKLLEESVRLAVRQLDNLVDITLSSVVESEHANNKNRAIGLGLMGFTDTIEKLGIPYESEKAYALIDEIMEFISYNAIDESADLAKEKGSYSNFAGSQWSKGVVPVDTLDYVEKNRKVKLTVKRASKLPWEKLRKKVKKGMRNATLMAIAPTANIGLIGATTPGLDPQFSQMFSRATSSGKFLEVNTNLVNDLKARDLWESVRNEILIRQGDISGIEDIPEEVKRVYKTSFSISPEAFIEVAARAQKWIDQAISRNMYLETRDVDEMMKIYSSAWEKGLKTTYYLHMKPRHTAEQSTTHVNKSETISNGAKFGFGQVRNSD
ncbi:MAG TPA: ribonucleoside-diphosphate reductase subunit alpha [Patescibacteria group bacterium]|nr:ribonucleoside-diphosphate reductase subunit alpha [Patescibacteria group bacterium]